MSCIRSPIAVFYGRRRERSGISLTSSDTAYAAYIRGNFTKGNCTKNRQKMDFTTTEKGKRLWTHDNLHIVNFASDSDLSFAAMKKWWEHAGPYRQP